MINRYIIPIRFSIVMLAVIIGSFYSAGSNNQANLSVNKNICINKLGSCSKASTTVNKASSSSNQRKIVASIPQSSCLSNQLDTSTYSYDKAIINILAQANATIDGYRQTALVNGESYIVFNNQLNNLYSQYNSQIQQAYNSYTSGLGNCTTNVLTPQFFQDYD